MAKDDMKARHLALVDECRTDNGAFTGPAHTKPQDLIERERQTKLLAAILEKMHNQ